MAQIKQILLSRGATSPQKAVTRAELESITGLTDRAVRHQIENERAYGALICFWQDRPGGYYLASDNADIRRHVNIMDAKIRSMQEALRPFRRALREGGMDSLC